MRKGRLFGPPGDMPPVWIDNFFASSLFVACAGFGLKKSSSSTSCDAVWVSRCGSKNVIAPADWIIPLTRWNSLPITAPARPWRGIIMGARVIHELIAGS